MVDPVLLAATNNVFQSEAVLAALGSTGLFSDSFWSNKHMFDIPYANGATLGSSEGTQSHYAAVKQLVDSRPLDTPTYVMDSWATLDLQPLGFQVRIVDEWFVRAGSVPSAGCETDQQIETIRDANRLAEWEAASVVGFGGVLPDNAGHTYSPSLLEDDRFTFYAALVEDEIASGVMLFQDPHVTGVFTLFTLPGHRGKGLASTLLGSVLSAVDDGTIATNPSPMSRGIFEELGFYPVGSRRIWMRPAG